MLILAIGVGIVVLVAAAWVVTRGLLAKSELERVGALAVSFEQAIGDRDLDAVLATGQSIGEAASHAADLTSDPLWRATEIVPLLGANTAAVRITSTEVASMSASVIDVLRVAARQSESGAAGVDVHLISEARLPLEHAATTFTDAAEALGALRDEPLIGPLADGVDRVTELVEIAAPAFEGAAATASVLPDMLGADGERHILLMLQNPAELRTGGGLTGWFALFAASDGGVRMVDQADSSQFSRSADPIIALPQPTEAMYGDVVGRHVQNASMASDFALTARLASAWWATRSATPVDAVVSVDPRVIQALLGMTGPVTLGDGTEVNADNMTQVMLVDPYLALTADEQTDVQSEAAQAVFDRVFTEQIDLPSWIGAMSAPIADGRVSIWSAHPREQRVIEAGPLGGALARHDQAGETAFALYLNDATTGKMGSFLDVAASVGVVTCRQDGRAEVAVRVTTTSVAPAAARDYPVSMTGAANPGKAGDILTNVSVAAPQGWFVGATHADGRPATVSTATVDGHPTAMARTVLAPGAATTLEFRFIAPSVDPVDTPSLLHTPTLRDVTNDTFSPSCE